MNTITRALISVYDKRGVVELARVLISQGVEILSTGGTAELLKSSGLQPVDISSYTDSPEILGGRVKSLHPKIHGGILAVRDDPLHREHMERLGIKPIDLVVVNFYPFEQVVAKDGVTLEEAIENIDIGGPTMLRSAAKNYRYVAVLSSPDDYGPFVDELKRNGGRISEATCYRLARKAFAYVARYDAAIANHLGATEADGTRAPFPDTLTLHMEKRMELRYGENPHQRGAFYVYPRHRGADIASAATLQGKALSLNNIYDANTAIEIVGEFAEPTCVIVKHNNPCGVATAPRPREAFLKAKECDPMSAFGGIVAINVEIDAETARELTSMFLEVVAAPSYTEEALEVLGSKKNLRVLRIDALGSESGGYDIKHVRGGALVQDPDTTSDEDFSEHTVPTDRKPTAEEMEALKFAWKVAKHVKSNAIVLARGTQTIGIGAGQMSRVDSVKIATMKANVSTEGAVLASDAFFPFRDGVDEAAKAGVTAVVQPGGSIRDDEVIEACNEHGIAMVFTGVRHFRH